MSLLRVRLVGEAILRAPCQPVPDVKPWQQTFDSMIETVRTSGNAIALAAPQVGYPLRFFVYAADPARPMVFVNPEILEFEGAMEVPEGCLSIPDFYPMIKRAKRVSGRAYNRWGEPFEFDEEALLGHAIQHETDHLDGKLMLELMRPEDQQKLLKTIPPELRRLRRGIRAVLNQSQ